MALQELTRWCIYHPDPPFLHPKLPCFASLILSFMSSCFGGFFFSRHELYEGFVSSPHHTQLPAFLFWKMDHHPSLVFQSWFPIWGFRFDTMAFAHALPPLQYSLAHLQLNTSRNFILEGQPEYTFTKLCQHRFPG